MKHIKKDIGNEPVSLKSHRSTPGATYNDCNKEDIRQALLKEQGHICAYCMQRISANSDKSGVPMMQIEHYEAQSQNEDLQLNYLNMLGVCLGNKGFARHLQHFDQSRGNEVLKIDPRQPVCEEYIRFSNNGEIYSDDEQVDNDLNRILNLNVRYLVDARKAAIDETVKNLRNKYKKKPGQSWSKSDLQKEIRNWQELDVDGMFPVFCQAAIYYLQRKLQRLL